MSAVGVALMAVRGENQAIEHKQWSSWSARKTRCGEACLAMEGLQFEDSTLLLKLLVKSRRGKRGANRQWKAHSTMAHHLNIPGGNLRSLHKDSLWANKESALEKNCLLVYLILMPS